MFRQSLLAAAWVASSPACKPTPAVAPAPPASPTSQPVAKSEVRPGLVLPEAERKHLAEIEHRALLLGSYGFPRLTKPWSERAGSPLARAFAQKATGSALAWGQPEGGAGVAVRRTRRSPRSVDLPGLLTAMLELASRFDGPPGIQLMIRGLKPVVRTDYDGAWTGDARFRMSGRAAGGGGRLREVLGEVELEFVRIPQAAQFKAATGWVKAIRFIELVEVTAAARLMEDATTRSGLRADLVVDNWKLEDPQKRQPVPGGVYLSDVDRDGWVDILVTDRGRALFHRGRPGGLFIDETERAGLAGKVKFMGTVAFGDLDGDGLPDLILGDRVYRNAGDARFEDVTKRTTLLDGPGTGITLLDYDSDGRIDVYLTRSNKGQKKEQSWLDGPGGPGNQLWRNVGDWRFEDVTLRSDAAAGKRSVFTAAALDANDDGRPDLYVIGEFGPGVLLLNDGRKFREHLLEDDDGDFGSMGLTVGDVNGDGRVDIYTANMYSKAGRRVIDGLGEGFYEPAIFKRINRFITGSELYVQTVSADPAAAPTFERRGAVGRLKDVGWAYGPALTDLDNDGDLDLYATAGFNSVSRRRPDG